MVLILILINNDIYPRSAPTCIFIYLMALNTLLLKVISGRKEGNVLFNNSQNFYLRLYGVKHKLLNLENVLMVKKKGKKMFYLMTHSTHFIYGIELMVKDHTDSKKRKEGRTCFT